MNIERTITTTLEDVRKDLGISSKYSVIFVMDVAHMTQFKDTMHIDNYEGAINGKVFGLAQDQYDRCFVFVFNHKGIDRNIEVANTTAHEMRHLWQYKVGFKKSSFLMPYESKKEEIDAREYATKYIMNKYKNTFIARQAIGIAIGSAISVAIVAGLGLLIKKAISKR